MHREQNTMITPELDQALNSLEIELSVMGDRKKIVLSDFDYTLCDQYAFNPQTNNHLADIDPEVVAAAERQCLIVATSRRATNPTVPLMWESGLVPPHLPVIVENGGSILFRGSHGEIECIDLIRSEDMQELAEMRQLAVELIHDIPAGQRLIFKMGRTMLLARLQDEHGSSLPHHQQWLAERLRAIMSSSPLQVVDTRVSVTVQHADVNKGTAFRKYLELTGVLRDSIYVIGMGDGENDIELFNEADLRLGFSEAVASFVDIDIPHGPRAVPHIFKVIESSNAPDRTW